MSGRLRTLLVGLLFAVAPAALAYPTLFGSTGGAVLPTAQFAPANQLEAATDYYFHQSGNMLPIRIVYRITPRLEVGTGIAFGDAVGWSAGAKYGVRLFNLPDFAVGGQVVNASDPDDTGTMFYLVHTHPFTVGSVPLNASVGVNWSHLDGSAFRAYLAAEASFANRLTVAGEMQTKDRDLPETDNLVSLVARYQFTNHISGQLGLSNVSAFGITGTGDHDVFFGIRYTFGLPSPAVAGAPDGTEVAVGVPEGTETTAAPLPNSPATQPPPASGGINPGRDEEEL